VASGSIGVAAVLAPGTSGTMVLAEASGGWSATLNGKPLTPLAQPVDGWAQGFALPPGGGRLAVTRDETARDISLGLEAAALFIAFVLALPGTRSSASPPAEARAARRRRRPQPAPAAAQAEAQVRGADDTTAAPAFASLSSAKLSPATLSPATLSPGTMSPATLSPATLSPGTDPDFGSVATAAFGPGDGEADDADYVRAGAGAGSGPQPPAGTARPGGSGSGPASSAAPRRGGQHAARHGKAKPARRWRGTSTGKSGPEAPQTQPQTQTQSPTQSPTSDDDAR
jgi:hypothetical protein